MLGIPEAFHRGPRISGFFRSLYYGSFPSNLIEPEFRFRGTSAENLKEKLKEEKTTYQELRAYIEKIKGLSDADALQKLRSLNIFGLHLPRALGGFGLSYEQMSLIASLLSTIGKEEIVIALYHCTAFQHCLSLNESEQHADLLRQTAASGSAALAIEEPRPHTPDIHTKAVLQGGGFQITGEKILYTNFLPAHIAVTARDSGGRGMGLFILDTSSPGIRFETDSHAPHMARLILTHADTSLLIGEFGQAEECVQASLDHARILLAACGGPAKRLLEQTRKETEKESLEKNELHLSNIASRIFAMEASTLLSSKLLDLYGRTCGLEASTAWAFRCENELSLLRQSSRFTQGAPPRLGEALHVRIAAAGSYASPSSRIAHEAIDRHMRAVGTLRAPDKSRWRRIRQTIGAFLFYSLWYPFTWIGWSLWPRFREYGRLAKHLRFAERCGRRLARASFYSVLAHGLSYSIRQDHQKRLTDIGVALFAITACVVHACRHMDSQTERGRAEDMADLFCKNTRREIDILFRRLRKNDDLLGIKITQEVIDRRYLWLED